MRLLWLSHLLPYPPKGGVLQRSYYLLREAARRHEVDLVALVQRAHQGSAEELADAERALGEFCRRVTSFRISWDERRWGRTALLARSLFSSRPYDANWLDQTSVHCPLQQNDRDYDLVHVDTIGLVPYIASIGGTPFVLNHHNIESQMMEDRSEEEPSLPRRLFARREAKKLERWEREWSVRAAMNTVVSPLDRDRLLERQPEANVRVVDNGVDVDYFTPRSSPEENDGHLVFVGGMTWYPNRDAVQWFVRAIWPRLLEDDPDRRAVLIGRNPPPEVRRAARDGGLSAPGFVDDIRPQVDRALAYVCPIRRGGGTRLKILDALAMAKPLVATSFAVEGLGLESGRHYLRAEKPEQYVRQIRRLENSPELRRKLGAEGRALVEREYAWEVVGERLDSAYDAVFTEST